MSRYEAKALGTTTNSGAELSEVYDPIIQNTLNSEENFINRIRRVPGAGDKPRFRARTVRNPAVGYYAENDVISTGNQTRVKVYGEWKLYKAPVEVTGLEIEAAKASGGELADIYNTEIRDATDDLSVSLGTDIVGTGSESSAGGALAGLARLIDDGTNYGTLYGVTRAGANWVSSGYDATAEAISLSRMRTMIAACEANGAKRSNLMFLTTPAQEAKYKALLDSLQVIQPNANRVGFENAPALDMVPIITNQHVTSGYIYLLDMDVLEIKELLAATMKPLPSAKDAQAGFIRTYIEFVCTSPNRCYKKIGLT